MAQHPSEIIYDELKAREWTLSNLANRMGAESCARNKLVLDMYFAVGPNHTTCRLGAETAAQIAQAFDVSPEFIINLENAWLKSKGVQFEAPPEQTTSQEQAMTPQELIAQIEAGIDGFADQEWTAVLDTNPEEVWFSEGTWTVNRAFFFAHGGLTRDKHADHVAATCPKNMRAIIDYIRQLEATASPVRAPE